MDISGQSSEARNRLLNDLKLVVEDAEQILKSAGRQTDESVQSARARFDSSLQTVRTGLSTLEERVAARTRDAAHTTDEYVHGHPWQSIGLGAVVGLICGIMMGRR
jgi:ElaB/YqjD/DUF883 family membrane-anchored ribosome-binding protein